MNFDVNFMKSKVAQRILLQFILCALFPILILALVSFTQVRGELLKQGQRRLHEASRSLGGNVYERLQLLENDLNILSLRPDLKSGALNQGLETVFLEHLKKRFKTIAYGSEPGKPSIIFGDVISFPDLSDKQLDHLMGGKALVLVHPEGKNEGRLLMMKQVDPLRPEKGLLLGEISTMHLWGLSEHNTLPFSTELAVLDNASNVIFSTHPSPPSFRKHRAFQRSRSGMSNIEWEHDGQEYQAGLWSVFMKYHWLYPKIFIVLSSPKETIFAPIAHFEKMFPLVLLATILVVFFFSLIQVRKTTTPIQKLKEGSMHIAMQDFDYRSDIRSGDEFEDLGDAFNEMARQLGRQFHALAAMSEIDRNILSTLDTERMVDTTITHMKGFFQYDSVCISLFDSKAKTRVRAYGNETRKEEGKNFESLEIPRKELKKFIRHRPSVPVHVDNEPVPNYLTPFIRDGVKILMIFPLSIKGNLVGMITLGSRDSVEMDEDDLIHARQLAGQIAVAIANVQLIEELNDLNWGALIALARAVDAKSRWTANHSERVTKQAVKIAKVLGMDKEKRDNLRRGALLHDIGKLAIPVDLLDRQGKLTKEEMDEIRTHPTSGARILKPVAAYASAVPMILQHHEHFDGTGYPMGLSGKKISLGGRILAVADVYDALVSDRPYRKGMPTEEVIAIIKKDAGRQFDPNVVKALLKVIEIEKALEERKKASGASDSPKRKVEIPAQQASGG